MTYSLVSFTAELSSNDAFSLHFLTISVIDAIFVCQPPEGLLVIDTHLNDEFVLYMHLSDSCFLVVHLNDSCLTFTSGSQKWLTKRTIWVKVVSFPFIVVHVSLPSMWLIAILFGNHLRDYLWLTPIWMIAVNMVSISVVTETLLFFWAVTDLCINVPLAFTFYHLCEWWLIA